MNQQLETKLAKLCATLERNRAKAEQERREKEDKKLARLRPWWTQAAQ